MNALLFSPFPLWGKVGMGAGGARAKHKVLSANPTPLAPTPALPQRGRELVSRTLIPTFSRKEKEQNAQPLRWLVS